MDDIIITAGEKEFPQEDFSYMKSAPVNEKPVVINNGKFRAAQRLLELAEWQKTFYANATLAPESRQVRRQIHRYISSRTLARAKKDAIANRRKK